MTDPHYPRRPCPGINADGCCYVLRGDAKLCDVCVAIVEDRHFLYRVDGTERARGELPKGERAAEQLGLFAEAM